VWFSILLFTKTLTAACASSGAEPAAPVGVGFMFIMFVVISMPSSALIIPYILSSKTIFMPAEPFRLIMLPILEIAFDSPAAVLPLNLILRFSAIRLRVAADVKIAPPPWVMPVELFSNNESYIVKALEESAPIFAIVPLPSSISPVAVTLLPVNLEFLITIEPAVAIAEAPKPAVFALKVESSMVIWPSFMTVPR